MCSFALTTFKIEKTSAKILWHYTAFKYSGISREKCFYNLYLFYTYVTLVLVHIVFKRPCVHFICVLSDLFFFTFFSIVKSHSPLQHTYFFPLECSLQRQCKVGLVLPVKVIGEAWKSSVNVYWTDIMLFLFRFRTSFFFILLNYIRF